MVGPGVVLLVDLQSTHIFVMATRKLLVRVMNDPNNKRTFKNFRIEEFPEMDVQSTTRMLIDMYGEHLGFSEAERVEIGYIGYSNKKFKIT